MRADMKPRIQNQREPHRMKAIVMPDLRKWQPWEDTPKDGPPAARNIFNSMSGPPCAYCRHWKPQVTYRATPEGSVFDGVQCCHADEMQHDFSCFRDREEKLA